MASTISTVISSICIGVFLLGVINIVQATGKALSRILLFIVCFLLVGLTSLPLIIAYAPKIFPIYMPIMLPALLALPGAVMYYIETRTNVDFQADIKTRHYIMPVMGLIIMLGYWLLSNEDRSTMFLFGDLPPGFGPSVLAILTFSIILVWSIVSFVYLISTMKRLSGFRRFLKDHYSNTSRYELPWVEALMAGLVLLWIVIAGSLVGDNLGFGIYLIEEIPILISLAILLILLSFPPQSADQHDIENTQDIGAASIRVEKVPSNKYAKSALTQERKQRLAKRIEKLIDEDELYLDPNFTIKKLSERVGAKRNTVSQTLNEEIGVNFFDYIASWRAKKAKDLLETSEMNILEVSLDVGFNSRSTFYKAFRKETGMTPKAYRSQFRN